MTALVIGLGNPFRSDDGVGPAVADELERLSLDGVRVLTVSDDPTELIDAWAGVELAVVVDAGVDPAGDGNTTPGRIRRWTPDADDPPAPVSSHVLDLPATYALGRVLGRIPQRLVVFAVDAAEVGYGVTLTPAVAAAVPTVAAAVLSEIGRGPTVGT